MRIVIADPDPLFRDFLRCIIAQRPELTVVAEVGRARDLMQAVRRHRPELVLLDLSLPSNGALEVTRWIKRGWPQVRVVVFAEMAVDTYRRNAERSGVDGFIAKDADAGRILRAIAWDVPRRQYRKTA